MPDEVKDEVSDEVVDRYKSQHMETARPIVKLALVLVALAGCFVLWVLM